MRVRNNMKFGIAIPATYNEDVELDRTNGYTYWQDANKKEIYNVKVSFKFIYKGSKLTIGFKKITCYLIFDVNFDLTRKSRYVGGVYLMQVPASMSYSIVVSIYSVRIMFLIAALSYLDIKMSDVVNS